MKDNSYHHIYIPRKVHKFRYNLKNRLQMFVKSLLNIMKLFLNLKVKIVNIYLFKCILIPKVKVKIKKKKEFLKNINYD